MSSVKKDGPRHRSISRGLRTASSKSHKGFTHPILVCKSQYANIPLALTLTHLAVSMTRPVEKPITLSDGTALAVGARLLVANTYDDPTIYDNPDMFVPNRLLKEREKAPEQMNTWQHVTVFPQHIAFGYGQHACPGRFFASNEMKIAMAHMLLKYDWKSAGDGKETIWDLETTTMSKPKCQEQLRRRKEEINLDLTE